MNKINASETLDMLVLPRIAARIPHIRKQSSLSSLGALCLTTPHVGICENNTSGLRDFSA